MIDDLTMTIDVSPGLIDPVLTQLTVPIKIADVKSINSSTCDTTFK